MALIRDVVLLALSVLAAATAWAVGPPVQFKDCPLVGSMPNYPRFLSWTGTSVCFSGFLARRDDDADCILLGGTTKPGSRKSVQSGL